MGKYSDCWTYPAEKIDELLEAKENEIVSNKAELENMINNALKVHHSTSPITPESGWTINGWTFQAGNMVEGYFEFTGGTLPESAGWVTLGTIKTPANRPSGTFNCVGIDNVNCGALQMAVTTAGLVQVYYQSGVHNNIRLHVTYIRKGA